jgi:hypothetical protein
MKDQIMKVRSLAVASLFVVVTSLHAQFATSVVNYNSGTGFAAGYTNPAAALGAPASGGSVTPFAPPFSKSQLVSIGTNGSLTLQFNPPIIRNPSNPYSLDFQIFGNTFFAITNGNFSGGGITSGALGGNNTGATMIEVSADGTNWFTLNTNLAPVADGLFPTDGMGDPAVPVNPTLTANSFAALGLTGIRALYNGSAGGSSYSLAWAQDTNGNYVDLPIARFVRVDVLANKSEIDAVAATRGTQSVLADDFVNNPLQNGWQIFGDTNLFNWNPTNQNLEVTWDSTQPNSYFYRPLGTILAQDDAFSLSFDLQLKDAVAFNYGMELAIGLFKFSDATNANFSRGGGASPNLFEFDYFPDTGYGDSEDATIKDIQSGYKGFYFPYDNLPLEPGVTYQVVLNHAANANVITGELLTNGVVFTALPNIFGDPLTNNFYVDTLSINSYTGDGYGDDILAHGTVKNLVVAYPAPPVPIVSGSLTNGIWQGQFNTRTNWTYTLQGSSDLIHWTDISSGPGNGTNLLLQDPGPAADKSFYRVKADRPYTAE